MGQSSEEIWQRCLEVVRENISKQSYKTWFEPLTVVGLEEDGEQLRLTIELPSRFYYEWLEEHYGPLLRKSITQVLGPRARLFYKVVMERDDATSGYSGSSVKLPAHGADGDIAVAPAAPQPLPERRRAEPQARPAPERPAPVVADGAARPVLRTEPPSGSFPNPFALPGIKKFSGETHLNPTYTFDRHIEGDCNRLARSASIAIAQQPGATSFNPFLIYGGVGLGKTHLIQAIGNFAMQQNKIESVLYISSERFTADFVQSIQHNKAAEFSLYFRQVDLLIVDDIQFFSGKEKTQEEFFHIFNSLHQSGKQIVLSADRPPRDIVGIEERLLSRFQWGLTADVQPPELETRIAILQRKAEDDGIDLDNDVVEFVAHNIKSNIRELEGAIIRLLAHATLHKRELDLPLAREVLRDLIKDSRVNLSIAEIQRIVCEYFNISEDLIREKTRKREVVQARQVAMYFCKLLTQHSLKSIGLHFGGRDHSTVIHANQSIEDQIDTDPKFKEIIEEIGRKIELRAR